MSSLKSKGIIAAAAGAVMFSGLSATAAPAISFTADEFPPAGHVLANHVHDRDRGFVFDLRDLFPNLNRGDNFRNRFITERRAGRIANAHTPLRIRDIDRRGSTFFVRGFNRRLGRIAVRVDGRSGRVLGVDRLERNRPARVRLIGALRAGEAARDRIRMRVTNINRDGTIYNVHGFNRRQGRILVQVDGRTGEIIRTSLNGDGTIGRSGVSNENGVTFRTNRRRDDYRDVGP